MLLSQDRRRHQNGNLSPRLHRFESGPQRHLGFAKANIPANQTVHRARFGHVTLHRFDGRKLIFSLREWKTGFEFLLPLRIAGVSNTRSALTNGLDSDQFCGQVSDSIFDLALFLLPTAAAVRGEFRRNSTPNVFLHQLGLHRRDRETRPAGEKQDQKFLLVIALSTQLESKVLRDAMLPVDHVITGFHFDECIQRSSRAKANGSCRTLPPTKQLVPRHMDVNVF